MQLQILQAWLPQIIVAALPGFIHQWIAAQELTKSLRRFPLFNPRKSPTYWFYRLFAFAITAFSFWFVVPLIFRVDPPSIQRNLKDWNLWGMALAVGFYFRHFLDAPISIVALGVFDIGPGYHKLVSAFRGTIIEAQLGKTENFWQQVDKELKTVSTQKRQQNYKEGYKFLRSVVSFTHSQKQAESKLTVAELERRLDKILPQSLDKLGSPSFPTGLSDETIELLKWLLSEGLISRNLLPQALRALGCYRCTQNYFPNATKVSRSRS